MATSWFKYNGGPVCDPMSYIQVYTQPNCPDPNLRLCAIFAEVQIIGGIPKPIIISMLCSEIHMALMTLTESANVLLCP
jgi:hypothetical protein